MRRIVMAPTTVLYSIAPAEMRATAAVARRLGLRLHSHLSETVSYQDSAQAMHALSPVAFCGEHDWLGSDVCYAHLVKVDRSEITLLADTRTGVAHCPQSNGRLGSGICSVREMMDAGVPISIGVDGAASNEAADMISEVHMAWLAQRARRGAAWRRRRLTRAARSKEAPMPRVSKTSSTGGRRAAHACWGWIALGESRRDFPPTAVYRLDDPRYFGLHDRAIGPVASGGRPELAALFTAGKRIVTDDAIEGIDLKELGRDARAAVRELLASA